MHRDDWNQRINFVSKQSKRTKKYFFCESIMKKLFSWRIFTSFGLFLSFFMILISGVILYIGPSGRGPGAMGWSMIGLTKPEWQNQHIIFGFAFSLIALFHLFAINWKAFFSYLKAKSSEGVRAPGELLAIIVLSLLFGIGTYHKVQPFSGVLEFGRTISKSWEGQKTQFPGRQQRSGNIIDTRGNP
jgi:magnesium-transporting ATPase (P-type)